MSGSARPDYATEFIDFTRSHAEVIDTTNQQVWQSLEPCSSEEFAKLELPEPYRRVGIGVGAMDEMWFDRSPGAAEDGPMLEREIDGRKWAHCARPISAPAHPFGEAGPVEMIIDKFHALRFVAGRRVPVLRSPEGEWFVHAIDGRGISSIGIRGGPSGEFVVPEGCALGQVELAKDWVLRLPAPTRVFFFQSGDSFQGPIADLPGDWVATTEPPA